MIDRWVLNRLVASEWGWLAFSNVSWPPAGSHPVAVEGAKTIAYEIAEDLGGRAPAAVVIPVAYGDSLAGIHRGFAELVEAGVVDRMPMLIAAEAYPTLSSTLASGASEPVLVEGSGSLALSVATPQGPGLVVTNEKGTPAYGWLSRDGRRLTIPDWNLTGTVRGNQIVWPNRDFWAR